jgi:hypothetical protein
VSKLGQEPEAIGHLTLRQWVLTVPFELRLLLATKPEALSAIGRIFVQEIQRWQRQRPRALDYERPETAAVSFCQRFGSSLNLNIHWHVIVPDAFFVPEDTGEHVDTLKHRPPTLLDLEEIVTAVATRCVRWLEEHSYVRSAEDEHEPAALTAIPRGCAACEAAWAWVSYDAGRSADLPRSTRAQHGATHHPDRARDSERNT